MNTGKTIDWGASVGAAGKYNKPPYNNCGAKYDVTSGYDQLTFDCTNDMDRTSATDFNNGFGLYQETTEREHSIYDTYTSPYDTF